MLYNYSIIQVFIDGPSWVELFSLKTFTENLFMLPVFPQYLEILNQVKPNFHKAA